MATKATRDLALIMHFINNHEKVNDIYAAFDKGPEPGNGFMWTGSDWWTPKEHAVIKLVSNKVLDHDWDSSGYGYMMRLVEAECKKLPVATAVCTDNDQSGNAYALGGLSETPPQEVAVENPEEMFDENHVVETEDDNGRAMARDYQKTVFGKTMDDNNKNALAVAAESGVDEAMRHMMKQAGGDYSRMRSMFG